MANISQSVVENFFKMLNTTAQEVVNASPSDLTIDAEIVEIGDISNGEYKVSYQGAIFPVYCEDSAITYKIGERVYVLVPQGDMSRKKLIYGTSSYKSESLDGIDAVKNFYIDQGPNWIESYNINTELGICSCPQEKELELEATANYLHFGFLRGTYSSLDVPAITPDIEEKYEDQKWQKIDEQFRVWGRSNQYLKIQADFQTKFSGIHTEGKYALRVACLQFNPKYVADETAPNWKPDEPKYKIITYELGLSAFTGVSPYSIIEPSTQKGYFEIPSGDLVGICAVALVQDGAMKFDIPMSFNTTTGMPQYLEADAVKNENNILVSNIQISFAKKVNLADTMYYPYIEAPMGKTVYDSTADFVGRPSVELIAHLQYGDTDITEQENCRVRWFRQKADVTAASADTAEKDEFGQNFFYYGGPGWYPVEKINEEQQRFGTEETRLYKVEGNKLTIYKEAVPWKWKYKAVIVYSTKEIDSNDGHEYVREINRSYAIEEVVRGDSIYDLELKPLEEELPGYYEIVNNKDTSTDKKPWIGNWYLADSGGGYNIISSFFHEGPLNILENPFYDKMSILVQCYDPHLYYPTGGSAVSPQDAHEVGVVELEFNTRQEVPFIITWEGEDLFKYDAQGVWKGEKDPKEYVLTPKIKFNDGYACSYSIEVIAPDGAILGDRNYYRNISDKQSEAFNCWQNDDFLVTQAYVDRYFGIHFSVPRAYDKEKAKNNIFKINVLTSTQEKFTFTKQINFMKDGDLGSNGTVWDAVLRPCKWRSDSKEGLFVEPYSDDCPYPLVVDQIPGSNYYRQNDNFRLFLRPYVTRAGVPVESLDKEQAIFYRCSWDVRIPGAETLSNTVIEASFLRLYHTSRGVVSGGSSVTGPFIATRGAPFNVANGGGFEVGVKGTGEAGLCANNSSPLKSIKMNSNMKTSSGWKQDPSTGQYTINGLVAHTVYPLSAESSLGESTTNNPFKNLDNECYGAVEVCYFENSNPNIGTGATLEQCRYRTIVKCTIDVIQGSYNAASQIIDPAASTRILTTLTCYYPVDIFFNRDNINFASIDSEVFRRSIHTNWPTVVKYDSLGYDPEHSDEILKFCFEDGENIHPYNLTPDVLSLEKVNVERDEDLNEISFDYKLRPAGHLSKQDGFHGAIRTVPNGLSFATNSWYLRNLIMYYDRYGNVDINGWDGQGLDTNEEDGTIFGATFGAGWKDNHTNAFTGILAGVDKSLKRENYQENLTTLKGATEAEGNHPYLTGIFGYQEGIKSFGLLENGTAFFGRADGGGRIIVDGANATIYGGANGKFTSPSIGDPMWNTLRINLVDLNHAKDREIWKLEQNPDGGTAPASIQTPAGYHVVNENGKAVDISLRGQSFGFASASGAYDNANYIIPKWYADIWQNAYIQAPRSKPYWAVTHKNSLGVEIPYDYSDLGIWDGTVFDEASNPDAVLENNKKIDYLRTIWVGLNTEEVNRDYINNPEYGNIGPLSPPYNIRQFFTLTEIEGSTVLKNQFEKLRKAGARLSISSYGPQRASTTPAIEIGQHIPGLRPGLLDWGLFDEVFANQRIPGNRNFLVTYDGTLWAMNGVFMGNVIGSNILGGRIQSTQIGVGPRLDDERVEAALDNLFTFYPADAKYNCEWYSLKPPVDAHTEKELFPFSQSGYSITLNDQGISSLGGEILGGSLDIGRFHVLGYKSLERLGITDPEEREEELGHLIQRGKSDFVGQTHFYGYVGIAPSAESGLSNGNSGILTQLGGFVALGVLLPRSSDLDLRSHRKILEYLDKDVIGGKEYYSGFIDPVATFGNGTSIENSTVFAIDSAGPDDFVTDINNGIRGHFWPLHFSAQKVFSVDEPSGYIRSYVTMMDLFKSNSYSPVEGGGAFEGSNYFRISPWGFEGQSFFVRNHFQPEKISQYPYPDTDILPEETALTGHTGKAYRGYIGAVTRAGYGGSPSAEQGALGITTWNKNAIIFHSDDTTALRTRGTTYFVANYQEGEVLERPVQENETWTEKHGNDDKYANIMFTLNREARSASSPLQGIGTVSIKTVESPFFIVIAKDTVNNKLSFGDNAYYQYARGVQGEKPDHMIGAMLGLYPYVDKINSPYDKVPTVFLAGRGGFTAEEADPCTGGGVHIFCSTGLSSTDAPVDKSISATNCRDYKFSETFWSTGEVRSWASRNNGIYSAQNIVLDICADGVHHTPKGRSTTERSTVNPYRGMSVYMNEFKFNYTWGTNGEYQDRIISNTNEFTLSSNKWDSNKKSISFKSTNGAWSIEILGNEAEGKRMVFAPNKVSIINYDADQQFGIYARFG